MSLTKNEARLARGVASIKGPEVAFKWSTRASWGNSEGVNQEQIIYSL